MLGATEEDVGLESAETSDMEKVSADDKSESSPLSPFLWITWKKLQANKRIVK